VFPPNFEALEATVRAPPGSVICRVTLFPGALEDVIETKYVGVVS